MTDQKCGNKDCDNIVTGHNKFCSRKCFGTSLKIDSGPAPICKAPECDNIVTGKKGSNWLKYCCDDCKKKGVPIAVKNTCLDKYGVTNGSKTKESKDNRVATCLDRYGVANPSLVQEFLDKIVETNIDRYGTDKPQLLAQFEQKSKDTCVERFGVEKPQRLQEIKDKTEQTCIIRYGVSAPQQDESIRQKSIDTCIKEYGVTNVMHASNIFDKNKYYQKKDYTLPSGSIVKIQGYEDKCLDMLLSTIYDENDLIINPSQILKIFYVENNKKHRYYPDIFIPEENLILEVKSQWTYNSQRKWYNTNLLKKQACLDAGYNFKFMIFDGKGNLLDNPI